ncbi:MAG: hypothetical protein ACH37Z_06800 [Anaerolineae bacterium]|jgi:Flp pilus assembly protein TadB|nr:hypothetical protein [Ardenticatenia bacterium]MBK8539578.1 hypothetical protein [Ardenticatenia bacterium]HQZ70530.1 hypothetical protein [Anaerolineae bacterium]HRA18901.1 hypothetical protein [Anaerolineae bacterium]
MLDQTLILRHLMVLAVFSMGLLAIAAGLWTLMSRDYQHTIKGISAQSSRLQARALSEIGAMPMLDASARLVEAVNQLIRTAMGVGVFLCIIGAALCGFAFWMLVR